ncbi:UNKNOWN [Stylonychia lemnae]|uniref:Transmembrane protein n=1 Tax=Stylonychia lemnae TaxID=5949 RepID=A0A078AH40_STYLE|nr:UNKNOWN [Stylonychia lemnae]|eukprot:CDW81595.1 UNKNOWN [Stylonychia lemnae]
MTNQDNEGLLQSNQTTILKPVCAKISNLIFTAGAIAMWFTYFTYYEINLLLLAGIVFPLENFVFLVIRESWQLQIIRYRFLMVYPWSIVAIITASFHSYIGIEMMQAARFYGEDQGSTNTHFTPSSLLQLQLFIYLLVLIIFQAFSFDIYVNKLAGYYHEELEKRKNHRNYLQNSSINYNHSRDYKRINDMN